MPNDELLAIERALEGMVLEDAARARDRIEVYDEALRRLDSEQRRATSLADRLAPAVLAGIATEDDQEEYLAERFRARHLSELYVDRAEARALAELPMADLPPRTIEIGSTVVRQE